MSSHNPRPPPASDPNSPNLPVLIPPPISTNRPKLTVGNLIKALSADPQAVVDSFNMLERRVRHLEHRMIVHAKTMKEAKSVAERVARKAGKVAKNIRNIIEIQEEPFRKTMKDFERYERAGIFAEVEKDMDWDEGEEDIGVKVEDDEDEYGGEEDVHIKVEDDDEVMQAIAMKQEMEFRDFSTPPRQITTGFGGGDVKMEYEEDEDDEEYDEYNVKYYYPASPPSPSLIRT